MGPFWDLISSRSRPITSEQTFMLLPMTMPPTGMMSRGVKANTPSRTSKPSVKNAPVAIEINATTVAWGTPFPRRPEVNPATVIITV